MDFVLWDGGFVCWGGGLREEIVDVTKSQKSKGKEIKDSPAARLNDLKHGGLSYDKAEYTQARRLELLYNI